jgi:hypothetical protein
MLERQAKSNGMSSKSRYLSKCRGIAKKLRIDFATLCRLGGRRRRDMDVDDRHELVRRLFALLTAKLEDGAALAADGQGQKVLPDVQVDLANRLHALGGEIAILADAVVAVISNV